MAQKIGGEYRPRSISRRHWERLAAAVRCDTDRLVADIIAMTEHLPDALATALEQADLVDDEVTVARAMVDALAPWVASCRAAVV